MVKSREEARGTGVALIERWVTLSPRRREKVPMPWKECKIVEERLQFIAWLLDGEKIAGLCREFGISRKTGFEPVTYGHTLGTPLGEKLSRGNLERSLCLP